jgi:hypothetical protein
MDLHGFRLEAALGMLGIIAHDVAQCSRVHDHRRLAPEPSVMIENHAVARRHNHAVPHQRPAASMVGHDELASDRAVLESIDDEAPPMTNCAREAAGSVSPPEQPATRVASSAASRLAPTKLSVLE